jgi:hypothetical protein
MPLIKLFYHRNLEACAPPAPRDPAPLLLRPAQARLNFDSGPAHPAQHRGGAKTHPTINCQLLTRDPKQGQGSRKCSLCLPNLPPGLYLVCQSTRKFLFSLKNLSYV